MKGLHMEIDCPQCGGDLETVNAGSVGWSCSTIIVACPGCRVEWQVTAVLRRTTQNRGRPPGPSIRSLAEVNA